MEALSEGNIRQANESPPGYYVDFYDEIGGEAGPGQVTRSRTVTLPRGTGRVLLTSVLRYTFNPGFACPALLVCSGTWTLRILNGTTLLHTATASGGRNNPGAWPCVTPAGRTHCQTRITSTVDLSGVTANNSAAITVETSLVAGNPVSLGEDFFVAETQFGHLPALQTLAFNSTGTGAVAMRIDGSTAIALPEWQRLNREKAPTSAAYDVQTSGPAAFLAGQPLKVRAVFRVPANWKSATIDALIQHSDGSASGYGQLVPLPATFMTEGGADEGAEIGTAAFGNAVSAEMTFASTLSPTVIQARDLVIRWRMSSVQMSGGYPALTVPAGAEASISQHRIYTLRKAPVAPMTEPWAKVLELTSFALNGQQSTITDRQVVDKMAEFVFYSLWRNGDQNTFRFFWPRIRYAYDQTAYCLCGDFGTANPGGRQIFDLNATLTYMQLTPPPNLRPRFHMMCTDNTNVAKSLAAVAGTTAVQQYLARAGFEFMVPTPAARGAGVSECEVFEFRYHQLPLLAQDVWDTSVRRASSPCIVGTNYFGISLWPYLAEAFPGQPQSMTVVATPSLEYGDCLCVNTWL